AASEASDADRAADRIDLVVDSSPIDLGVVQGFTTALTKVAGTAEAHVRVTGTAEQPEPNGRLVVRNGAFRVEPTGSDYRHVSASVDLQPDRIHIAELTVLDNHDSALSLTGDVALDEARVRGVELYVTSEDFKVLDNELGNIRVQSSLGLTGELTAPQVGGYLGITSGELNVDNLLAIVGTSPYQPVESADTEGAASETGDEPTGPYEAAAVDVTVDVPNALVVRGDNLQLPDAPIGLGALTLTLGGDVRATKKPGDTLRLVGTVNTVRGEYDFQGRRFEILRDGGIRFVGLEEINPTLDLRTRRLIQGVEARVNIRGTLRSPQIELASTPPLEPADILSLIVFNQPLNQLGEGQQTSLLSRAQALAAGAVAGQLAQSIGNALNLDTFEIQVAPEFGGGPQVTLGQQVSDRLFLRVQQGIGVQSTTNLVLEYQVSDWLRLQTKIVQGASTQPSLFLRNQGSGADLLFFFSY
ncbi:MAG: translocation/assembly module TamB domain-containing protein, partial [Vicinamibacterales bacterium]